ncbi:oligosaccharide flippase family protein [Methanoculleus sp. Wushi-C6]|uniref:Oligosaccharide flippase family protein n=1 Tax=Methanoculleus caldifontis TaxID=2651577 RepID=A0ABU3X0T5_9EURY|nr:oligosaccharide flippase family protein [Methanoculleus sp. Wushi-C6]MDV2481663.1 oligosaccharide flippase family protein [Methanoculleus sp. Wushi-C6]
MTSFLSNLFKLTSGTVIAQVAAVLLIPVATRIYAPEFFGVNQLFLSIATVITVVSSLSYHFAIMVTEEDEDSVNVLALCVVCVLGIATLAGIVFVAFGDWFGALFNMPMIADYLILLPFFVIFSSLFVVLNDWLSRKVRYGPIARGTVINSVSTRVFQIGAGLVHASPLGLILGSVVGAGLAIIPHLRSLREDAHLLRSVTPGRMKDLARRYSRFAIYASFGSLANSASWELPAFMLAYFFNPVIVGFYALAIMAVRLPMMLVGTSITQVFFQKASEERIQTGSVRNVVREVHTRLIAVGLFPFVLFAILAEDLFTFVFGADWLTAGTYAMILTPWLFTTFAVSPITSLFGVLDRQRAFFFFEVTTLCTWLLLFSVSGVLGNPVMVLMLFSAAGVILWGAKSVYLIRESGIGYRDSFSSLARHLLISVVLALPLIVGRYMEVPFLLLLVVAGIAAVAYYLLIFFTDTLIRREVIGMIRGSVSPKYLNWLEHLALLR